MIASALGQVSSKYDLNSSFMSISMRRRQPFWQFQSTNNFPNHLARLPPQGPPWFFHLPLPGLCVWCWWILSLIFSTMVDTMPLFVLDRRNPQTTTFHLLFANFCAIRTLIKHFSRPDNRSNRIPWNSSAFTVSKPKGSDATFHIFLKFWRMLFQPISCISTDSVTLLQNYLQSRYLSRFFKVVTTFRSSPNVGNFLQWYYFIINTPKSAHGNHLWLPILDINLPPGLRSFSAKVVCHSLTAEFHFKIWNGRCPGLHTSAWLAWTSAVILLPFFFTINS